MLFRSHVSLGHNGRLGTGSTVSLVRLEIFRCVFIIEVSFFLQHCLGMVCATSVVLSFLAVGITTQN